MVDNREGQDMVEKPCSSRSQSFNGRSYWIPGSYAPTWSEKRTSVLKAIEKEGLQGGQGDNNWVVRHRHIHDPGIQQEPELDALSGGFRLLLSHASYPTLLLSFCQ